MSPLNPLFDPATDNAPIAADLQNRLNTPTPGGQLSEEDRAFLEKIKSLVAAGTLELHTPSTLLNQAVYAQLPALSQGRADQLAFNMLIKIREILDLEAHPSDTLYQEQNLLQALLYNKTQYETELGDVFLI